MDDHREATVVAEPGWDNGFWWVVFALLGVAAGWLLTLLADWVASLPWAPLQGPFKLVSSLPEPLASIGAMSIGTAAGLAFAYQGQRESLTVTVATDRVGLARAGDVTHLDRAAVAAVFRDGKQLVLLGRSGEELARESCDLDTGRLREAFTGHGYPWHPDGDPYHDDYRRWVPETPDLPAAANALLKAREQALRKNEREDAAELRAELARLGVVVREEQHRQYWRRHRDPGGPAGRGSP